jgi:hypothetical protein
MTVPRSTLGLLVGVLLGIAAAAGGFVGFLIAVVLGGVGLVVGAALDGDSTVLDTLRGRRR